MNFYSAGSAQGFGLFAENHPRLIAATVPSTPVSRHCRAVKYCKLLNSDHCKQSFHLIFASKQTSGHQNDLFCE